MFGVMEILIVVVIISVYTCQSSNCTFKMNGFYCIFKKTLQSFLSSCLQNDVISIKKVAQLYLIRPMSFHIVSQISLRTLNVNVFPEKSLMGN